MVFPDYKYLGNQCYQGFAFQHQQTNHLTTNFIKLPLNKVIFDL